MNLELDHVFVFVEPGAASSAARLAAKGLRPNFRRRHEGLGTANLCYVFDNAYLECLWVDAPDLLARADYRRTGLFERANWADTGASPIGVCVRSEHPLPFPCWLWQPPFLPPGLFLEVATASSNPKLPFLFRFPGAERPDRWQDDRGGARQREAGLAEIDTLRVAALPTAEQLQGLILDPSLGPQRSELTFTRSDDGPTLRLSVPDFSWVA